MSSAHQHSSLAHNCKVLSQSSSSIEVSPLQQPSFNPLISPFSPPPPPSTSSSPSFNPSLLSPPPPPSSFIINRVDNITPSSTPIIGLFNNTPTEARNSPSITAYPSTFVFSPRNNNNSICNSADGSSSSSSSSSSGRTKSQKARHSSHRSGSGLLSPQSSSLIYLNSAYWDSPTSMSPYDHSPSRSGSTTQYADLTQKLNKLSLGSPSKRSHPKKMMHDIDDITANSSESSSNSSSNSSDDDDDDGDSILSYLSSSSSTGCTENLTKSYDDDDDDDDDVTNGSKLGNNNNGINGIHNNNNNNNSNDDNMEGGCGGHTRSRSIDISKGSMSSDTKLISSLSSLSSLSFSSSKWKTPKGRKIGKFSQSMGVLPHIPTPRYMDKDTTSTTTTTIATTTTRSTIVLPPSPRLFRDETRNNTVILTPVQDLPELDGLCNDMEDEDDDVTVFNPPDSEHVLAWSFERNGMYTSPDAAYDALKSYYAGDRSRFREVMVLDCRYEYEYNGGHIKGAISVRPPNIVDKVHDLLFKRFPRLCERSREVCMASETSDMLILVYCEFSRVRGPMGYKIISSMDRSFFKYPCYKYRNLFLIKGGYRKFYERHSDLCTPCGYVKMNDEKYAGELERCLEEYEREKAMIDKNRDQFKSLALSNNSAVEISCPVSPFL